MLLLLANLNLLLFDVVQNLAPLRNSLGKCRHIAVLGGCSKARVVVVGTT